MTIENLTDASSTHYQIERSHFRNSGTISMPVYGLVGADVQNTPGATAPCRLIRLHAPIEGMTISWSAVKEGSPPQVPNPYLFDPNLTFKSGRRSAAIPIKLAGYTGHAWSMSGVYEYHMTAPIDLNSALPLGVQPWENLISVSDSVIPAASFINTLLEKPPPGFILPTFIQKSP